MKLLRVDRRREDLECVNLDQEVNNMKELFLKILGFNRYPQKEYDIKLSKTCFQG